VDLIYFWQEVALRAKNNYGDWANNKEIAEEKIKTAIKEIMKEEAEELYKDKEKVKEILDSMIA